MAIQFLILASFATLLVGRSTDITSSLSSSSSTTRRRPTFWALFSQLSQQQIAENIQRRYLEPLLQEAGLDISNDIIRVEKLSDLGFSNNVFRVEVDNAEALSSRHQQPQKQPTILVAKIFSDLAKKRVDPNQNFMGEVDELLYRHGLGPKVIAHTDDALLMEYIEGQVLTESMIFDPHKDKGLRICSAVGDALGRMHNLKLWVDNDDDCLPRTQGPNMLWHALDVMLSSIDTKLELTTDSGTTWTLAKLQDTIGDYRNRLETLSVPCVAVGHGDFKLSNVMMTTNEEIRFIDFELTGTHYRGYDLAKFFRSAKQSTGRSDSDKRRHQHAFWESYHRQTVDDDADLTLGGSSSKSLAESLSHLEWEAELLEPMTWLEAASFFLSMATLDDPSQREKWENLAQSRMLGFERVKLDVKR